MKRQTETALVRACLQYLSLRGILAWRNNTTGVYDPVRKRFRTFTGMKGVADVLGVLPGGRLLAVEAKQPRGRLSEEQKVFLDGVNRAGGLAVVVRDVRQLAEALEREGVLHD